MSGRLQILTTVLLILLACGCGRGRHESDGPHSAGSEVERLRSAGITALNKSQFDSAITCGLRLLDIAAAAPSERSSEGASIYGNILLGQGYLFNDSVSLSYAHLHKAERLCLELGNDSALASAYNGLGIYASNVEKDFPGALRYFFLGLDAAKRSANERMHSLLLVNIALIYALNDDPASLRYALECYRHGQQSHDDFLRYTGALTAAYTYAMRRTDTQKALEYIREAEFILHRDSIRDGSTLYYIYGLLQRRDGNEVDAYECFVRSMSILRKSGIGDVRSYIEYADILFSRGSRKQAVAVLDSALRLTDSENFRIFRRDVLNALASTHRALGNAALARSYAHTAEDELNAERNAEQEILIKQIKGKYDLERADNEVNRQRILLLKKQRTVNFLIAIIAIAATLAVSFIYLYRRKSRLYAAFVRRATESAREEAHLRATISNLEAAITTAPTPSTPECCDGSDGSDGVPDSPTRTPPSGKLSSLSAPFESLMLDPAVYTDKMVSKDKIARMLGTNRTYISRLVNEVYKMTFPQFINSLRIKEAIRRLSDPLCDTPLKALSSQLGYSSMTTFYSKFSEATGMTPAAFREKSRSMAHDIPAEEHS